MRYKVIVKQYKSPGHYLVQFETGQVARLPPEATGRSLSPGETGRLVQGHRRQHFKPDAIEGEYVAV